MRYYERVVVSALEPKSTDILWVQPNTNNDGINFKAFVNGKWSAVAGAVSSVNGKTGTVVLNASDVNALPSSTIIPDVSGKEDTTNKVTSLSSLSTDTQYPSAKCIYDLVGDVETILTSI